jgi:outer membrane protein assembly factor BamB
MCAVTIWKGGHCEPALVLNTPYSTQGACTVSTSPVLAGNAVYFAASDGTFRGVDPETGKAVWTFKTGAPSFSSVAVSGNTLFAADFSGNVYAFTRKVTNFNSI